MDLAAWWQARRWPALLELIEQLPAASRLKEALAQDPDHARLVAFARAFGEDGEQDGEPEPWSPRLSEYDLHAQLLREVANTLAGVYGALVNKNVGELVPGPRTEIEKQAEELERLLAVRTGSRFGFDESDFT